jgi:phenolic acid decarboxylase
MIFMIMNLYGLTYIQNFEVSIQVVIRTSFNNIQQKGFEFEIKLKTRYTIDYTVEVL